MPDIKKSVGFGGVNNSDDVKIIQTLLNQVGDHPPLTVNGVCGDETVAIIKAFQSGFFSVPDGRIDPGGKTFKRLLQVTGLGYVQLPQGAEDGYYSYSVADNQFGTAETIKTLQEVAAQFHALRPDLLIGIGDISFRDGHKMPPHKSHINGRNMDIRPLRKDGAKRPIEFTDKLNYDREATRLLAQTFLAHSNVKKIFFNDPTIEGVKPLEGHHNHLHVETKA
ncbi:MAG: penicillin-insensitive murein endopeptidase [Acidobacteria bacterium]|nr:penicillin-insensitive murein endopeptidase [Acidobacteriota bacterium]